MTDTRSDTATAEQETADRAKHAPLPLPAGSFYLQDLERIGDAAVNAKPEERDALVSAELERANQRTDNIETPGAIPGHDVQEVERVLVEGVERPVEDGSDETETAGEVRVVERVQVYNPEKRDEVENAGTAGGFDAAAFVDRNLDDISDTELRGLSANDLTAVREAEATARNRSTLLNRIDTIAGEQGTGA
jgi:hypothetical protein